MKRAFFLILFSSIFLKVIYVAFAFTVNGFTFSDNKLENVRPLEVFKRNDAHWYRQIAENGYPKVTGEDIGYSRGPHYKQSEWAFFPFYPVMLNALMSVGLSYPWAAMTIAICFSFLAYWGFFLFCFYFQKTFSESLYCTFVLMLFPFHYYFSMYYTEAIYFALVMFSFLSIIHKKYIYLPILLSALVLTRPNGIVVMVPIVLYVLEREDVLIKYRFNWKLVFQKRILAKMLPFLIAPIVFLAYCVYQEKMTGEFFAFSIAQKGWYREFMFPLLSFFRRGDFTTQFNSVFTILVILIAALLWKRFPLSLNVFIWIGLVLPLFSGSVVSMPRFISVIFPLTMALGSFLYRFRFRNWVLIALLVLQVGNFYFWLIGDDWSY